MTRADEAQLALAAQRGDMKAKDALFRRHAALVKWLSFRFSGPDREDLFAAGSEGWMHALRTWKPASSAFKTWMTWWVRAYAGRAASVHAFRRAHERGIEFRQEDGELTEVDMGDEGLGAEDIVDELWRRQAHSLIDGMRDRRLALVLQERMRGLTLQEVAERNGKVLRLRPGGAGREWVRRLELLAVERARRMARAV